MGSSLIEEEEKLDRESPRQKRNGSEGRDWNYAAGLEEMLGISSGPGNQDRGAAG